MRVYTGTSSVWDVKDKEADAFSGVPETVAMSPIEREIRKRTAWAIFWYHSFVYRSENR